MGSYNIVAVVFALFLFMLLPDRWKVPAAIIVILGGLVWTNAHGKGTDNIVAFFTDWESVQ